MHLTVPRQQIVLNALKVHQVKGFARISHIDHSCSKAWVTEMVCRCYGREVVENAFVDVIHEPVAVGILAHGNAQAVAGNKMVDIAQVAAGNEAVDSAQVAVGNGVVHSAYMVVEIEAADSIHRTGSDYLAGEIVKGPVESRLDAEEVEVEGENLRALALVLAPAPAPALVLAIRRVRLHATKAAKTIYYRGL